MQHKTTGSRNFSSSTISSDNGPLHSNMKTDQGFKKTVTGGQCSTNWARIPSFTQKVHLALPDKQGTRGVECWTTKDSSLVSGYSIQLLLVICFESQHTMGEFLSLLGYKDTLVHVYGYLAQRSKVKLCRLKIDWQLVLPCPQSHSSDASCIPLWESL